MWGASRASGCYRGDLDLAAGPQCHCSLTSLSWALDGGDSSLFSGPGGPREQRCFQPGRSKQGMEQRGDKAGPLPPWADSLCLPPARGSRLGGAAALASLLLPPCLQRGQMGLVRGRQVCLGLRPPPRPAGGTRRAKQAGRWWPRRGAARADGLTVRTDGGPGRGPEPAPSAPGPWWDFPHPPGATLG